MYKLLSELTSVIVIGMVIICLPSYAYALSLPQKSPTTIEEIDKELQKQESRRSFQNSSDNTNMPTQSGLYDPFEKQRNEQKELKPIVDTSSNDSMNYLYIVIAILILALLGSYVISQPNKSTNKIIMNKTQKYILAGFVPLLVLLTALGLATGQGSCFSKGCISAFEWGSTWFIWVVAIGLITIFEYRIFKDR